MNALDTNVLVRYLVGDDRAQSALATRLMDRAAARGETQFVSDVVICETVWVLASVYRQSRTEIAEVLSSVFRAAHLAFTDPDALLRALAAFIEGRGDFADYVIQETARAAGCDAVATFDKTLLKEKGFVSP